MGQSGVGGSGSILGHLVARRTQLNAIRQKLGMTPGSDLGGVPQGGLKSTAPASPTGPAAPAAPPAEKQPKAPTAAPAAAPAVPMASDKRAVMLEKAATFLSGLPQAAPTQPRPPAQPTVPGRARQILSGGI